MTILVLEDKLGITDGYMPHWTSMCMSAGLGAQRLVRYSAWKSPTLMGRALLVQKGNRKSPGFNPDLEIRGLLHSWAVESIVKSGARAVLCMDVALLGLVESRWEIATIDNLRGGLYWFDVGNREVPFLVTVPISAIHNQKKPKDIRRLNDGYESKDEWDEDADEHDPDDIWMEPYTIPYGRFVLMRDLQKLARIVAG